MLKHHTGEISEQSCLLCLQSGHAGAHAQKHTTEQPELSSDKLGVLGGQERNQPGQTSLASVRYTNQ